MASRTLRSNSKNTHSPSTSYSSKLRNSRNREESPRVSKIIKERPSKIIHTAEKIERKSNIEDSLKEKFSKKQIQICDTATDGIVNCIKDTYKDFSYESSKNSEKNIDVPPSNIVDSPTKRKRGRPSRRSAGLTPEVNSESITPKGSKKPKLENPEELKVIEDKQDSPPQRRKPRMASLNALAKVNAVLENYRFEKTRDLNEAMHDIKKESTKRKFSKVGEIKRSDKVDNLITPMQHKENRVMSPPLCFVVEEEVEVEEDVFIPEPIQTIDHETQTDISKRSISLQTEQIIFPKDMSETICTCSKKKNLRNVCTQKIVTPYVTGIPLHLKSSVLAHTTSHTLAIPVIKTHYYQQKSVGPEYQGATNNITNLLDRCMNKNFSRKDAYPVCAKLMQVSAQRQVLEKKRKLAEMAKQRIIGKKNDQKLVIPSLDSEPISVNISASHPSHQPYRPFQTEEVEFEKKVYKKQQVKSISRSLKVPKQKSFESKEEYNGWEFEGDFREESYNIGRESIRRRYYSSLRRKNQMLRVYDAVILRSGLGSDSDYVARICSLWQDDIGPFAGEMMMSVQWYYKPEQTNSKNNEPIKGQHELSMKLPADAKNVCDKLKEKMEVFASRHKDDNSVACIIDRCFVVTYSQYCRFKAQKRLLEEKHRRKLYVVPEKNNIKSRLLPIPPKRNIIVSANYPNPRYASLLSSTDSNLEAFSHNLTDGSFAPLPFQASNLQCTVKNRT